MTSSSKLLLVLTATISPAAGANVARRDPAVRRADYLRSFDHWLKHPDPRLSHILFVENSGVDLSEFQERASRSSKEVEILSIPPNPPPPGMHYGYSELEMIDIALASSRLVAKTSHLIKATGRLMFPAITKLLDRLPREFKFVADARARLPFRPSEMGFVSIQLFLASYEFYNLQLRKSYLALEKSGGALHFAEHLFYDLLMPLKDEDGVYLRFPVNCEPVGFAGSNGIRYDGPRRVLAARARAVARVIAPKFWL